MKHIEVTFQAGPGRTTAPGIDVNYMQAIIETNEGDEIELYAEEAFPESVRPETEDVSKFDDECYPRLKAAIIRQAKAFGIDPAILHFWWD